MTSTDHQLVYHRCISRWCCCWSSHLFSFQSLQVQALLQKRASLELPLGFGFFKRFPGTSHKQIRVIFEYIYIYTVTYIYIYVYSKSKSNSTKTPGNSAGDQEKILWKTLGNCWNSFGKPQRNQSHKSSKICARLDLRSHPD